MPENNNNSNLESLLLVNGGDKLKKIMRSSQKKILISEDYKEALDVLSTESIELVIINEINQESINFLTQVVSNHPFTPVTVISDNYSVDEGIEAIQKGSFGYVNSMGVIEVGDAVEDGLDERVKRLIRKKIKQESKNKRFTKQELLELGEELDISRLSNKNEDEKWFHGEGAGGRRTIPDMPDSESLDIILRREETARRYNNLSKILKIPKFSEKFAQFYMNYGETGVNIDFQYILDNVRRRGKGFFNHLYIIAGPTCVGKTEISSRVLEQYKDTMVLCAKPTDRPRRKGETDGQDHIFVDEWNHTVKKDLIFEFEAYGCNYGIPESFENELRQGNDGILIVSNFDIFEPLLNFFRKRFSDDFVVPVFLHASNNNIYQRLNARETDKEQYHRRKAETIKEMRLYESAHKLFKYALFNNSRFHRQEELKDIKKTVKLNQVVSHFARLIELERATDSKGVSHSEYHEQYIDSLTLRLFGRTSHELQKAYDEGREIELNLDEEVIKEYQKEKNISKEIIKKILATKVCCVTKAYGRVGIYFKTNDFLNYDFKGGKELLTDLIQKEIRLSSKKFKGTNFNNVSHYGVVEFSGKANDSLYHSLTYDLTFGKKDAPAHGLVFGFLQGDSNKYRPLTKKQINSEEFKKRKLLLYKKPNEMP